MKLSLIILLCFSFLGMALGKENRIGRALQLDPDRVDSKSNGPISIMEISLYTNAVFWWGGGYSYQGGTNYADLSASAKVAVQPDANKQPFPVGLGMNFEGVDDTIAIPDDASLTVSTGGTWSTWYESDRDDSQQALISKRNAGATDLEYQWYLSTDSKMYFAVYDAGASQVFIGRTSPLPSTGVWHNVVATWDGGTAVSGVKIYTDGLRSDTSNDVVGSFAGMDNTTSSVNIGTLNNAAFPFNGRLADVRIFNREFTSNEVWTMFAAHSNTYLP